MLNSSLQDTIISLLKSRKEEGLSLLYDHYSKALYGIVNRIVTDVQLAEEVLQTVFLKIWNNFDKFDEGKASIYTWSAAIARNASIDAVRLKRNQLGKKTEDLDSHVNLFSDDTISDGYIDTGSLLKNLDEKYAVILEYLYLRGYTQQEFSDEFNVPLGTVKTRLKQAINILRSNLGEEISLFASVVVFIYIIYLLLN